MYYKVARWPICRDWLCALSQILMQGFLYRRENQQLLADKEEILDNQRGIAKLRELHDNLNARSKDFERMRARHLG